MNELETQGYFIIRNALTNEEVETARSFLVEQTMDYDKMKRFIEGVMLERINKTTGFHIQYTKFRVSNNNNSVDAAAFHRDISPLVTNVENIPIYTCLCYLDSTVMEIIPGTHNKVNMTYPQAFSEYGNRKQIVLGQNDCMIFRSTLLHRGIFTENLKNRRLIQVFDCYKSKEDEDIYKKMILDVKGSNRGNSFAFIFHNSLTAYIPNLIGYYNSATGMGVSDKDRLENYQYFSSEGGCKRLDTIEPNTMQKLNLYYINNPNDVLPDEKHSDFIFNKYTRQFIFYSIFIIIFLLVFIFILYKLYYHFILKKRSKTVRRAYFRRKS